MATLNVKKRDNHTVQLERCDSCGRRSESVALCLSCGRQGCDRKKCRAEHGACFTPDEFVE
jgi:uncharacterized UBP type Zn finger protein